MVHLGAICEFSQFLLGSSERFFADYFGRSQGLGLVRKGERKGDNTKTKTKAKQKIYILKSNLIMTIKKSRL